MAEIVKLAPNTGVDLIVKYADVVEGQYGNQIRLKGPRVGETEDVVVYVPVDLAQELVKAGAKPEQTDKGLSYRLPDRKPWRVEKVQLAGEKHATMHLALANGKATTAGAPAATPEAEGEPEAAKPSRDEALVNLFTDSLKRVAAWAEAYNALEKHTVKFEGENVASITATLFIARSKAVTGY